MASAKEPEDGGDGQEWTRFLRDKQLKILLVEDDDLTLRVTEKLLRHCKYEVVVARNGREALQILEGDHGATINLVLTDLLMPEVDGMQLIDALQNNEFQDVPIVVMSSQSSQEAVLKAFEAGAKDYLIKPVRKNELTTLWQHLWRFSQMHAEDMEAGSAPASSGRHPMAPSAGMPRAAAPGGLPANKPALPCGQRSAPQEPNVRSNGASAADMEAQPAQQQQQAAAMQPAKRQRVEYKASEAPSAQQLHHPSPEQQQQQRQAVAQVAQLAAQANSQQPGADVQLPIAPLDAASACTGQEQPGRANPVPLVLRELAAWGARLEAQRVEQQPQQGAAAAAVPSRDGTNQLHHSASRSAFQNFGGIVPRPCTRGDASAVPLASASALPQFRPPPMQQQQGTHAAPDAAAAIAAALAASAPLQVLQRLQAAQGSEMLPMLPSQAQQPASQAQQVQEATPLQQRQGMPQHPQQRQQQQQQQQHQHFAQAFQSVVQQHQASQQSNSATRAVAIAKFREKRKMRNFNKTVRYESRRRLAKARPRVRGQFVTAEVAAQCREEEPGQDVGEAAAAAAADSGSESD